jgi:hypothetical protein
LLAVDPPVQVLSACLWIVPTEFALPENTGWFGVVNDDNPIRLPLPT